MQKAFGNPFLHRKHTKTNVPPHFCDFSLGAHFFSVLLNYPTHPVTTPCTIHHGRSQIICCLAKMRRVNDLLMHEHCCIYKKAASTSLIALLTWYSFSRCWCWQKIWSYSGWSLRGPLLMSTTILFLDLCSPIYPFSWRELLNSCQFQAMLRAQAYGLK